MRATAWRLRLYDRDADRPDVGGQPRAAHLRREQRNHEGTHRMVALTHELFEQQAALTPEAVAVVFGGETLSYRELNERANQAAHYLRRNGVGPDTLVGLCMERTPLLVIALLAVWKAGGAYVPLDPSYPKERLSFMIDDSQPLLVLTDQKCLQLLSMSDDKFICLDTEGAALATEPPSNPTPISSPSDLAYVIYTSGSTG